MKRIRLGRIKLALLSASAAVALAVSLATGAQATSPAKAASGKLAVTAASGRTNVNLNVCQYYTTYLGALYVETSGRYHSLDWWAGDDHTEGNPVKLNWASNNSPLDCFRVLGGFGNNQIALQLAHSNLCLNVAGNSKAAGAWLILYRCTFQSNELFYPYAAAASLGGSEGVLQSASSGLCIDLSNGWNPGSILVQKPCVQGDPWQAWFNNNH